MIKIKSKWRIVMAESRTSDGQFQIGDLRFHRIEIWLADGGGDGDLVGGMGFGGEGGGPGEVAVAGGVVEVASFAEDPAVIVKGFAEGKEVGGDVLFIFWKAFFGVGELVHEG